MKRNRETDYRAEAERLALLNPATRQLFMAVLLFMAVFRQAVDDRALWQRKKYLGKQDAQEVEIDKLTAKINELQEAQNQQRKGYENNLAGLTVE
jgi:hypothetical protein